VDLAVHQLNQLTQEPLYTATQAAQRKVTIMEVVVQVVEAVQELQVELPQMALPEQVAKELHFL
jgi:hypothetical protein